MGMRRRRVQDCAGGGAEQYQLPRLPGQALLRSGKIDEAWDQYKKLIAGSYDKTAYYTLGVIAWKKTYTPDEARAGVGHEARRSRPDQGQEGPGSAGQEPADSSGRLAASQKAMEIDPEYDDAMAYTNLLYREKADLEGHGRI